ncbi:MAG: hypothetical protein KGL46_01220 [Hyphomicrobiales bacterium]|nr:hypothetical protein [Hyphomicrobiales bacterium]
MSFSFHIKLPGGVLKVKTWERLRSYERDGDVPVRQVGSVWFCWWSDARKRAIIESEERERPTL